ncbi:hypothetical protein PF005_g5064 [Phytophthora fragariae]|uniref:RxLR effector protein n=1 Tax=Phytophthora fragariae TaxID=53985 RepID=A0A6A3FHT2_9STRA|nr:hypothetical protein PF003_g26505 [Phytophthora fragariae]KAE8945279.1 hypothetical protein PF009_g5073 [Phytophthora fragariae]KAE8967369.1 hypothetical protein PF011_g27579 [Phytophthora fragariae]KAE9074698.1 hypothetical protein PF006_g28489 [Phytophthora fragariae]KAE9129024.1 hypothetical protein PF007_g5076 [Phytophthora fragariae]
MRLSATLLVVAAAGLFATGHAATDLSQTKLSQSQGVAQFENTIGNGKRLLRTVDTVDKDDEEERVSWAALLVHVPGTAQNVAKQETKIIKSQANKFAYYLRKEKDGYDVAQRYMRKHGLSNDEAFKMGLRYDVYKENPSLFH